MPSELAVRSAAVAFFLACSMPGVGWAELPSPERAPADTSRGAEARADTTTAADSTRAAHERTLRAVRVDSTGARRGLTRNPFELVPRLDLRAERSLGAASLEDAIRFRRALVLGALPLQGATVGSLALPDGGGPIRIELQGNEAERATDATPFGSTTLGWGMPGLATALSDPRADAVDPLDIDALTFPSDRTRFRIPGEALAHAVPVGPLFPRGAEGGQGDKKSRTALFYRKGEGDALATGIRFQTAAWGRRMAASYTRNQADGLGPIRETVSWRYALRAEVLRALAHRFEVEGLLFRRSIQDLLLAQQSFTEIASGRSEWERRHVALSASREGERWTDVWRIRLARAKETWVISPDQNLSAEPSARERWKFPTLAAEGSIVWRPDSTLAWIASVDAASRRIVYREDSIPALDSRRNEARGQLGVRLGRGDGAGVGIDAAYDARETQPGFLDGRVAFWGGLKRLRARVDFESAHDRPSWVDLLTPARLHFFQSLDFVTSSVFRSGNPDLKPRRLRGALGTVGFVSSSGRALEVVGSVRRVTDDFGWDLEVDSLGGSYLVSDTAGRRGDGWVSHVGLHWDGAWGPLHARGVGWVRSGPDSLSPHGGSPPRAALDADVAARVALFRGDLPLRIGIESHARGPRRGVMIEPGQVTWDGSLSAYFGNAGLFLRAQNVFDRAVGSAVWDPFTPSGAVLPGRTFHFGVVWNLVD